MKHDEVPPGLQRQDTPCDDAPEGEFSITGCAEHVRFLQEQVQELKATIVRLRTANGKARGQLASTKSRLRVASEVAVRAAVDAVNEEVKRLEGERFVGEPTS